MVGFCLDTCHAHAGGNALETVVDDVLAITGRIDLVHCNDSRDEFDSGADRHANLGAGKVDPDLLAAVVRDAGAPVVLRDPRAGRRARRPTSRGCASGSDAAVPSRTHRPSVRSRTSLGPRAVEAAADQAQRPGWAPAAEDQEPEVVVASSSGSR